MKVSALQSIVPPGRFDVLSSTLWPGELGWKVVILCLQKKVTIFKLPIWNGPRPTPRNCMWKWNLDGNCTNNLIIQAVVFHDQHCQADITCKSSMGLDVLRGHKQPHLSGGAVTVRTTGYLSRKVLFCLPIWWTASGIGWLTQEEETSQTNNRRVCAWVQAGRGFLKSSFFSDVLSAQVGKPGEVSQDNRKELFKEREAS